MPTQTFYNLKENKKNKVVDAIKKEFSSKKILDFSVKNIVEEAGIARGSFYQYFLSKEDVIDYILEKEFRGEIELIKALLTESNGDLFEASYKYLILSLNLTPDETQYTINIIEYLKDYAIHEIKKMDPIYLRKYIACEKLNINSDTEYVATLSIIISLICTTRIYILSNLVSYDEGIQFFNIQIDLIKRGIAK